MGWEFEDGVWGRGWWFNNAAYERRNREWEEKQRAKEREEAEEEQRILKENTWNYYRCIRNAIKNGVSESEFRTARASLMKENVYKELSYGNIHTDIKNKILERARQIRLIKEVTLTRADRNKLDEEEQEQTRRITNIWQKKHSPVSVKLKQEQYLELAKQAGMTKQQFVDTARALFKARNWDLWMHGWSEFSDYVVDEIIYLFLDTNKESK